jgi:hypothetical protein
MLARKALAGTAAAPKEYVEDVFNTWVYTGSSSAQSFTNNIDLSTEGGLVWTKKRVDNSTSGDLNHILFDTARQVSGDDYFLSTNTTSAQNGGSNYINFNTDGFGWTGSDTRWNYSGDTYVSFTFRKAEKFFDVVTYTGNGSSARTVSHNLGSVPGCVIIRCTSTSGNWVVRHRGVGGSDMTVYGAGDQMYLNSSASAGGGTDVKADSTTITINSTTDKNVNGDTYVAYLFAHDAGGFGDAGSDSIIKCGSLTTDGSGDATVTLDWEPQWLLLKPSSATGNWLMVDTMRGWNVQSSGNIERLFANLSNAESAGGQLNPTATGFKTSSGGLAASTTYIYIAIRRGPMKTPTSGTSVFSPSLGNSSTPSFVGNFPVDLGIWGAKSGWTGAVEDRLRGSSRLFTNLTDAEATGISVFFDNMTGFAGSRANTNVGYGFRRAPGFFDVVCYTGTGSATTFSHNLGVVPEMMIVKHRNGPDDWAVYHSALGNTKYLWLNSTNAEATSQFYWNNTTPTTSVFTLGTQGRVNDSGGTYVAYLFASVSGVSKVGSYTGNGSSVTVTTGFQPRFILVKRTDSTGDWLVSDSARGLVAGNDPYLELNTTDAEVTNEDWVDVSSTGFTVNQTTNNANVNTGTYIYLAIA